MTANPDAELIAACASFIAYAAERDAEALAIDGLSDSEARAAEWAQMAARADDYLGRLDAIAAMLAHTPEGMRAKARVVMEHWGDMPPPDAEVAASVLQDLLRGAA